MLEVTNPNADELESVLRVCFRHVAAAELPMRVGNLMQLFADGLVDLNGVFQAKQNGSIVGGMYTQSRPDGSVMLFVPSLTEGLPIDIFFEPLDRFCRASNAFAAVALADKDQRFDEQTFCGAGQFRLLSDLLYLAVQFAPAAEKPMTQQQDQLQFLPLDSFPESVSERLVQLVGATYEDSLDFPALMQMAPVEYVLQGYKTGTLYRPELWFFVQYLGEDAGVLLMTDLPPDQMELTYMGLTKSFRRKGLSRHIVQFAKHTAGMQRRNLLLTSADEKNVPAIQCYLSHGFQAWDRKRVFARFFDCEGAS